MKLIKGSELFDKLPQVEYEMSNQEIIDKFYKSEWSSKLNVKTLGLFRCVRFFIFSNKGGLDSWFDNEDEFKKLVDEIRNNFTEKVDKDDQQNNPKDVQVVQKETKSSEL